jgi:hypothetical protein
VAVVNTLIINPFCRKFFAEWGIISYLSMMLPIVVHYLFDLSVNSTYKSVLNIEKKYKK